MLDGYRQVKVSMQPAVCLYPFIVERLSMRNEVRCDFGMPVSELERAAWAKPIIGPSLNALAFSPDPASDQIVLVCVEVAVERVVIDIMAIPADTYGGICVYGLDSQIQLRYSRYSRKVNPWTYAGSPRSSKRRRIVVGK